MFQCKPKMQKIGAWYLNGSLSAAFHFGTLDPLSSGDGDPVELFSSIYAPVRIPTSSGMPDDWTYVDVGFSSDEIADAYAAIYSGNFWPEYFETQADFRAAEAAGESIVVKKIKAVIRMNWLKYMKLFELGGYTFNPLYNVDGEELYSSAEIHGEEIRTSEFDDTNTHTVSTYDAAAKEESTDRSYSGTGGDTVSTSHVGTGQGVDAAFNAFNESIEDSDLYHADRRVRRGNIGLTKSTDLAQAFREDIRNSILIEFFEDLNKVLLIPIY